MFCLSCDSFVAESSLAPSQGRSLQIWEQAANGDWKASQVFKIGHLHVEEFAHQCRGRIFYL